MIQLAGTPVVRITQPPIARPPTPPPGSSTPDAIDVHASERASRARSRSKNSRKTATKLRHDASSRATPAISQPAFMCSIWRATPRRPGTASRSDTARTSISPAPAARRFSSRVGTEVWSGRAAAVIGQRNQSLALAFQEVAKLSSICLN